MAIPKRIGVSGARGVRLALIALGGGLALSAGAGLARGMQDGQAAPAPVLPPAAEREEEPPEAESVPADRAARHPEVTVTLKDGQQVTGLLVEETREHLVLKIAGIRTTLPAASVERYRVLPSIYERYREIRDAVGEDPEQIVRLAEWLREREEYELALIELDRAIALNPDHGEARRQRVLVASLIQLRERAGKGARPEVDRGARREGDEGENRSVRGVRPKRAFPLLTAEQIDLMKVYEVDLTGRRPARILIERGTVSRLLERYAGHPLLPTTREGREDLFNRPPAEILSLMFRLRARDLYKEVRVLDQPEAVRLFRDDVQQGWLLSGCATAACHGGEEAGRLMLYNHRRSNTDPGVYTNLLILDRFRLRDGTPLIDYDRPEKSPLLQMALPREESIHPHPDAPRGAGDRDGWRPVLRSTKDRRFKEAVAWIESMYRPRPPEGYPVEYEGPGAAEAAAPAGNGEAEDQGAGEPGPR